MLHRTSMMALGFILIFAGAQLNVVERYTMTPRMTNFLAADVHTGAAPVIAQAAKQPTGSNSSPYYQASHNTRAAAPRVTVASRDIVPPRWLCWPVLFLGAVVLLHGASMPRR